MNIVSIFVIQILSYKILSIIVNFLHVFVGGFGVYFIRLNKGTVLITR